MFPHLVTATDVPTLCKIDDVDFGGVDAGGWAHPPSPLPGARGGGGPGTAAPYVVPGPALPPLSCWRVLHI